MPRTRLVSGLFAALVLTALPVQADQVKCRKTIISSLFRYKKAYLKALTTCLNADNVGSIGGPCPGNLVTNKTAIAGQKASQKIAAACTMADLASLGYRSDCAYEAVSAGKEGQCAALPVSTTTEFARCMRCWKEAELAEFVAILYASHAVEYCGGDLGETSPICSDLDCTTPLPDQHDLGQTAENDCQVAIGKAGMKYLLAREAALEKCGLKGGTSATCLADAIVQAKLQKAEAKKQAAIENRCAGLSPAPNPVPGNITWWATCPESASCPGAPLTSIGDVVTCVDTAADAVVDELLCIQFPTGWPCPPGSPSGAFL